MPEKPLMLLYVGEDFLYPTVFDARGAALSMNEERSRHFWLYFNANTRIPEYAYEYKSKAANKIPGCIGHFLDGCAQRAKVDIDGAQCDYYDLLERSGLISDIKKLYAKYTRAEESEIPIAFVFAENVPTEQRNAFISAMERYQFVPVAHSVLLSELIMDHIMCDNALLNPVLGDKVLILNAVCDKLVMTDVVFDGERWMSDGTFQIASDFGDAPIKDAFVKYVIRTVDRNNSFLHSDALKNEEFEFQRMNADKWMNLPRSSDGSIFVSGFNYKSFGGPYSCIVDDRTLQSETAQALRTVEGKISDYRRNRIGDSLIMIVLLGAAFDDSELVSQMMKDLGNPKHRVITTAAMPSLFSRYQAVFGSVRNNFKRFDSEVAELTRKRQSVTAWSKAAADIRNLRIRLKEAVRDLSEKAGTEVERCNQMEKLCISELEHSAFQKAEEKLSVYPMPSDLMLVSIQKANSLADDAKSKRTVFESVKEIPGARSAIDEIEAQISSINDFIRQSKDRENLLNGLRNKIKFYEAHYEEYVRLKNQFNSTDLTVAERRAIREKMKELTMEPLPELTLHHVRVRLNPEICEIRKLFSRTRFLKIQMDVLDGDSLPCDAVLNIAKSAPFQASLASSSCIRVDIEKGEKSYSGKFSFSDYKVFSGDAVYIAVFTEEHQIDTEAIRDEKGDDIPMTRIKIN